MSDRNPTAINLSGPKEDKPPTTVKEVLRWKPKFKRNDPFAMLIFASRNSGKSYLIRHLIRSYLRRKYDLFIVVSDSPDTESDLSPVCPEGTIFLTEMDYASIDKMQEANAERLRQNKEPLSMLIIFDDKIGREVKNDDQLLQLFTRGRHLGISLIFSSQSKKFAETTWLNNADYVILLKANSQQQRKTILDNVIKGTVEVPDGVHEEKYLRAIMGKYMSNTGDALVIDSKAQSNNNLMWYRAP